MGSTWDNRKKSTLKEGDFGYQNHKLSASPLLYFLIMADVWNFCDTFLRPYPKNNFYYFSKCWFIAEIKGLKITPLVQVKSKVPILWPGHVYTFCLWQMVEIFVVHFKDSKLKAHFLFYFSKSWFVAEIQGFKVTPLLHVKLKELIDRPGHFYTFYSWKMFESFLIHS